MLCLTVPCAALRCTAGLAVSGVDALQALEDLSKQRAGDNIKSRKPAGAAAGAGAAATVALGEGLRPGAVKSGPKKTSTGTPADHPGYQLLFWDATTGEPLRSLQVLREIDWASTNCPIAWEIQGAWPASGKGLGEGSTWPLCASSPSLCVCLLRVCVVCLYCAGVGAHSTRRRLPLRVRGPMRVVLTPCHASSCHSAPVCWQRAGHCAAVCPHHVRRRCSLRQPVPRGPRVGALRRR